MVDEAGTCLWRGKAPTDPDALAEALAPFSPDLAKVGLETCCWATWLCHGLRDRGLPAVCMDARQAPAALSLTMNKTDANNARGLAHLLRAGVYREVRLKGWDDVRMRTLIHARRSASATSSHCSTAAALLSWAKIVLSIADTAARCWAPTWANAFLAQWTRHL